MLLLVYCLLFMILCIILFFSIFILLLLLLLLLNIIILTVIFLKFNNTLNTFYPRLYGIGDMIKDYSDSQRKLAAATTWATPHPNQQQGFCYMHHPIDMIAHTMAIVTPVVEHWLEQEIAQWVHNKGSIQRPIAQ